MSRRSIYVTTVDDGGVAAAAGIQKGDRVIAVDGEELHDSLDFELLASEPEITIELLRMGRRFEARLCREWGEGLGLTVSHRPRACKLRCRFCFVDQHPRGLRPSLCLKDDDLALSFRDGNFLTLSNLDDEDLERIGAVGLSPLYVSVHATDPEVRQRLLRPTGAAGRDILAPLRRLVESDITIHAQIVLVPGYNDGPRLERTLRDLAPLVPTVASIAVVPVGITRFQPDETLRSFEAEEAAPLLRQLEPWQRRFEREVGVPVVMASDEWYLLAGEEPPPAPDYDGFPQIENGVGIVRSFLDELDEPLDEAETARADGARVTVVTGRLAAPVLERAARQIEQETGARVTVRAVDSAFWGPRVTVAGLLTGEDLVAALRGVRADRIVVPSVVFNEDGELLDGRSAEWLSAALEAPVVVVSPDVAGLRQGVAGST